MRQYIDLSKIFGDAVKDRKRTWDAAYKQGYKDGIKAAEKGKGGLEDDRISRAHDRNP